MSDKKRDDSKDVSKAYADRLGEQQEGRIGWDGKPLSEKDRRLYGLRESGYQGPIDQDGYMGGKMW